jgi:hypothetical protein
MVDWPDFSLCHQTVMGSRNFSQGHFATMERASVLEAGYLISFCSPTAPVLVQASLALHNPHSCFAADTPKRPDIDS